MRRSAERKLKAIKLLCVIAAACLSIPAIAQQPVTTQAALPVYDIVSIHPHSALDNNAGFWDTPNSISGTNITLKELISYAYQVREDLISGLPGWVDSTHFDITAKVSNPDHSVLDKLTREQIKAMLRPVLADRFQLKVHTVIKILPVYDLVLTRDGPKFKKSPPLPENPDHPTPKGRHRKPSWQINNGDLTATALPLYIFTNALAEELNRTVLDKTGLTDVYDLKLKWTPDDLLNTAADNGTTDRPPGLFTALQEQLGLKLDAAKGPVETLVIDHAEKPSPN